MCAHKAIDCYSHSSVIEPLFMIAHEVVISIIVQQFATRFVARDAICEAQQKLHGNFKVVKINTVEALITSTPYNGFFA